MLWAAGYIYEGNDVRVCFDCFDAISLMISGRASDVEKEAFVAEYALASGRRQLQEDGPYVSGYVAPARAAAEEEEKEGDAGAKRKVIASKKVKDGVPRTCGYCSAEGHDRRNCPSLVPPPPPPLTPSDARIPPSTKGSGMEHH